MKLLNSLRALLALPDRVSSGLRDVERSVRAVAEASEREAKKNRAVTQALHAEIETLRVEVHERLLQYHLQLGRLSAAVDGNGKDVLSGGRVPVTTPAVAAAGAPEPPALGRTHEWLTLKACPACGTPDRTVVCEWNKLVLLDTAPDRESSRYDYAVCHGCGILYATERPLGSRYRYLVDHFEDVLEKNITNPLINPHPLSDADRDQYRALVAQGVLVSDHTRTDQPSSIFFGDRVENAGHVDILGSLLNLRGARVLEVRPRSGTILDGLRRHYGADVYGMPMWESQQFILRELYGVPAVGVLDFEHFSIPAVPTFDLIVCNHMFNHAVRLEGFLKSVRDALKDGGHLYLYNEIDDSEFLDGGQSMIATMNPLHLQAADRGSLVRALQAAGFVPVFIKGRDKRNICLMRKEATAWTPMSSTALDKRIRRYQRARDRAVLRAPERVRSRFAEVWPATVERAVAAGVARFDEDGSFRLVKDAR